MTRNKEIIVWVVFMLACIALIWVLVGCKEKASADLTHDVDIELSEPNDIWFMCPACKTEENKNIISRHECYYKTDKNELKKFTWIVSEPFEPVGIWLYKESENGEEYKCEGCGGTTTNQEWFNVHNCISTSGEYNSQGLAMPELRGAFAKDWPGRKGARYGYKNKYWDDEKRLWIEEPNEPEYYNAQFTISRNVPPDTALVLWVSPGSKFHKAIIESNEPSIRTISREEEQKLWMNMSPAHKEPNYHEISEEELIKGLEQKLPFSAMTREDLGWPMFDISDFIPTWPDYIELEKDLIVDPIDPNYGGIYYHYPKGTRIYFKEDKE